jgi:hypothetical protein
LNLGGLGGESEDDLRKNKNFARMQDTRGILRGEEFRGDGDLERAGSNVGKGELAVIAGQNFVFWGSVVARERYAGSGDGGSGWVNYAAADISRQLLSRLLTGYGRVRERTRRRRGRRKLLRLSHGREPTKQEA